MIPKLIFQTWETHDVPGNKHKHPSSKKTPTPLLSNDDRIKIIEQHFPDFMPYFLGFKYNIQRADAIRHIFRS